jgi:hypothetical protein
MGAGRSAVGVGSTPASMSKAKEYRRYAAECIRLGQETSGLDRAMLLEMAERWRHLAEQTERWQRLAEQVDAGPVKAGKDQT